MTVVTDTSNIWAVLASGPSLGWDNYADVETIRQAGINTIAVNTTWQQAPFCRAIYAGDAVWWKHHHKKIDIPAERWSMSRSAAQLYGATERPRWCKNGYNSGANAVELAVNHYGARVVLLLGFDCSLVHGVHHHGNHRKTKNPQPDQVAKWRPHFAALRKQVRGATVINCSRYTELTIFPRQTLQEALCALGLTCATPTTSAPRCLSAG